MHTGLFIGLCTVEIAYYLPGSLQPGQRMKAERQLAFAGGGATNAAISFTAFENIGTLVTGLGEHPLAEVARADIMDRGLALIDLDSLPQRPPSVGSVLVDLETHEYSVAYSSTFARKLKNLDLGEAMLCDVEIVFLDGNYLPQALSIAAMAKKRGLPVVLGCGVWKERLEELLPHVDYLIVSRAFRMPNCTDEADSFAALAKFGVQHIAVTHSDGPITACDQGRITSVPVNKVEVLDSLGAGDVLHGAFCHFILEQNFLDALRHAAELASQSCTSIGPRAWIEQHKAR